MHLPPSSLYSGLQLVAVHTPLTHECPAELSVLELFEQSTAVDADRPQKSTFDVKSSAVQSPPASEKPELQPVATHLPDVQVCALEPRRVAVQSTAFESVVPHEVGVLNDFATHAPLVRVYAELHAVATHFEAVQTELVEPVRAELQSTRAVPQLSA